MVTENPPECRALIVEDEYAFQKSLEIALKQIPNPWKMEIFSRGQDAIDFISNLSGHLDVALVDLGLPDTSGNAVIEKIRAYFPKTPILVVTTHMSRTSLISALRAGANGYVLKDATRAELTINIEHILGGRTPISPALTADIIYDIIEIKQPQHDPDEKLSKREIELLERISEGLSYAECANEMGLQLSTVHSYSRALFRKLGINSKSQAVVKAQQFGIKARRLCHPYLRGFSTNPDPASRRTRWCRW
jgi:DNA-binding NarL/FixJ family response regulator